MDSYINKLTKDVTKKYDNIAGGSTTKTNDSLYYVDSKISKLESKRDRYNTFATSVTTFSSNAKQLDKEVASKIGAAKEEFIGKHDYVDVNWWTELKEFFVELKNSCPLFEVIGNLIDKGLEKLRTLWENLKYWYRLGGGKELVGAILAVLGAIAAVIIFICSFPVSTFVAACALIGAAITAISAITNAVTAFRALNAHNSGDPAWAKIYSEQDTIQDVLRQTNWGSGFANKWSNGAALTVDIIQTVCDVVAIYDGIKTAKNIFKEIKTSADKGNVSFGKRLKQYIFNSDSYQSTKAEKVGWRDTLKKRGEIRTLREYGATKARTIKQYNDSLTSWQKFAKRGKAFGKALSNISKYGQKGFDYTLGGKGSVSKVINDAGMGISKIYKLPDTGYKVYDLYDKNFSSFKSDYKSFQGLKGLAG